MPGVRGRGQGPKGSIEPTDDRSRDASPKGATASAAVKGGESSPGLGVETDQRRIKRVGISLNHCTATCIPRVAGYPRGTGTVGEFKYRIDLTDVATTGLSRFFCSVVITTHNRTWTKPPIHS